jgi:nickel/cobalt transporter (NicO) family protein
MFDELQVLLIAAASIGFFHTLFGPDHYLPFVVMSKAGKWSLRKTTLITFLCGLGHVLSSVLLGAIGVALGVAVTRMTALESLRGNIAAWALIAFGLVYFAWGMRQAFRNKPHQHVHSHAEGILHEHDHVHHDAHLHAHFERESHSMRPWILFTVFVFGPCEPLIPLLMYPAAKSNLWSLILVTTVFGAVTITTMISIVLLAVMGISFAPVSRLERYAHAVAGATIFLCGVSIQCLGL